MVLTGETDITIVITKADLTDDHKSGTGHVFLAENKKQKASESDAVQQVTSEPEVDEAANDGEGEAVDDSEAVKDTGANGKASLDSSDDKRSETDPPVVSAVPNSSPLAEERKEKSAGEQMPSDSVTSTVLPENTGREREYTNERHQLKISVKRPGGF